MSFSQHEHMSYLREGTYRYSFTGSKEELLNALDKATSIDYLDLSPIKGIHYTKVRPDQKYALEKELLFDLIVDKSNILTQHNFYPDIRSPNDVRLLNFLRYPNPSLEEITAFVNMFPHFLYLYIPDPLRAIEENPDGLVAFLAIGPHGIYSSGRSRTTMKFAGEITSLYIPNDILDKIRSGELLHINGQYLIPVTRYAKGMSRGLYYVREEEEEDEEGEYCGTFFYFEPESEFILLSPTIFIAFNKIGAAFQLLFQLEGREVPQHGEDYRNREEVPTTDLRKMLEWHRSNVSSLGHYVASKLLSRDLLDMYEAYSKYDNVDPLIVMADFVLGRENLTEMDHNYRVLHGVTLKYVGEAGATDQLDQPICIMAEQLKIDVIILTNEMGETRSVGEVLDTRLRQDSIASLRKII